MNVRTMLLEKLGGFAFWALLCLGALSLSAPAVRAQGKPDLKSANLQKTLDRLQLELDELRRVLNKDKGEVKRTELIDKARAEVKTKAAEAEKLRKQLHEANLQLAKAQKELRELEGPRPTAGGPWGGWGWGRMGRPGFRPAPAPRADPKAAELERLERLLKEVEELRKLQRR